MKNALSSLSAYPKIRTEMTIERDTTYQLWTILQWFLKIQLEIILFIEISEFILKIGLTLYDPNHEKEWKFTVIKKLKKHESWGKNPEGRWHYLIKMKGSWDLTNWHWTEFSNNIYNDTNIFTHFSGEVNVICQKCQAKQIEGEKPSDGLSISRWHKGKVIPPKE